MNSILHTDRLTLRPWETKDLLECIEMNLDKEVMKYFPAILTKKQTIEFYDRVQKHFLENGFGFPKQILVKQLNGGDLLRQRNAEYTNGKLTRITTKLNDTQINETQLEYNNDGTQSSEHPFEKMAIDIENLI